MTLVRSAPLILDSRPSSGELATLFSKGIEAAPAPSHASRRATRKAQFAETPLQRAARIARAAKAALARDGLSGCLAALDMLMREKSIAADGLPDPATAMSTPDGLCGMVSDLSVDSLMAAFGRGLYPSAHFGPLRWWAPSLRAIMRTADIVERAPQPGEDEIALAFDSGFEASLALECDEAPLTPRLKWASSALYDAGFAHCFAAYTREGKKIGAGFGVAVGDVFSLSALSLPSETHARLFIHALARRLAQLGYAMIDARTPNVRLMALGFAPMPRPVYNARIMLGLANERIGKWSAQTQDSEAA